MKKPTSVKINVSSSTITIISIIFSTI